MSEQRDELAGIGCEIEADLLDALENTSTDDVGHAISKIEQLLPGLAVTNPPTAAWAATARVALLLRAGDHALARSGMGDVLNRVAPQHVVYAMTPGLVVAPEFLDLLSEESRRVDAHPFAGRALQSLLAFRDQVPTWTIPRLSTLMTTTA